MAISHKDHDHPNTPAARAACRKAMGKRPLADQLGPEYTDQWQAKPAKIGRMITEADETRLAAGLVDGVNPARARKAAGMTVVPRRKGDGGVVKSMQATAPVPTNRRLKVSGSLIKNIGDLADVPHVLTFAIRQAWSNDLDVVAGHPFNEAERRVVIHAEVAEIALVWDESGRIATFVRSWDSSVTRKVKDHVEAFRISRDSDAWPWRNDEGQCI